MKTRLLVASVLASTAAASALTLFAQERDRRHPGTTHVPDSTIERGEDHGLNAHTNHVIHLRASTTATQRSGEAPSDIRSFYSLPSTGGSGVIAIVDAYDDPTALADFNTFSKQWSLPPETSTSATSSTNKVFQVIYANGSKPRANCGWAQEEALDIEWAHAMAPNAKIVLVEAASNSFANLMKAVDVANNIPGIAQVSMSWGGSEFSSESAYDAHFSNPAVAYFAASGDTGGKTIYPSVSPWVVSAGGTTLTSPETGWSGSGGGRSAYESIPGFQSAIPSLSSLLGTKRGTPDFSFDADPSTGVAVYDSTSCQGLSGWLVFGGTSVSSPSLAGIVNLAAATAGGAVGNGVLGAIYGTYTSLDYSTDFNDIKTGTAGSYSAGVGWDFVTGIGSPKGLYGK